MQCIALEGNTQKLDGGAMFGNAPREMWKQWVAPDALNRITLACRSLLIQTDSGQNILFEVGVGAFFEPKLRQRFGVEPAEHRLLQQLEAVGLHHTDIDHIILSHLHFDHVGGLLPPYEEGKTADTLLFPNALYHVGKQHWQRALKPQKRERASFIPKIQELLSRSGRLVFIEDGDVPDVDIGVTPHFFEGHTVGMMVSEIQLPKGVLVFAADLIPGMPWVHLPIAMGYDRFPEATVTEKEQFLTAMLEKEATLFFPHDPDIPSAKVCRNEKGHFYCQPIALSNLI